MPVEDQYYKNQKIREKITTLPVKPGVYVFRDRNDKILYIGKAGQLKNRIKSYFRKSSGLDVRKAAMIGSVDDFEYTVTGNELEALILEANLIKQYRPRYNILLRDDKSYPYLKLTLNEKWPRLEVVRRIKEDGAKYYGPYVPSGAMWSTLSFIRDNFRIPTCKYSLDRRMRPCIQHQIKKCLAPCTGLIDHDEYMKIIDEIRLFLEGKNRKLIGSLEKKMKSLSDSMKYEEAAFVRDRIRAIHRISETQKIVAPGLGDVDVIGFFRKGDAVFFKILFTRNGIMIGSRDFHIRHVSGETDNSLMKNFIEQFYGKEIILPQEIICSHIPDDSKILSEWLSDKKGSRVGITVPNRGIKRKLMEMAVENAESLYIGSKDHGMKTILNELAVRLKLHKTPVDIGAFDVSNISGKEPVGAFVYWADSDFRKEKYRHIRMEAVKGPDDYAMMREMVRRTFKKAEARDEKTEGEGLKEGMAVPDLIVIDGGKGQLEAAQKAVDELGIAAEVIGIAKDPDRVFLRGQKNPFTLEDGGASSLLLKKIRDEAHRFAISYHKKLRSRRIFESPLEKVHGIGRKRRFELLKHFGSIDAIRNADVEDIAKLKGFNKKIAERVLNSLK
ncbi:MAG: excinuclease ABC subunit UvrC [Nitrospirota bacterium]